MFFTIILRHFDLIFQELSNLFVFFFSLAVFGCVLVSDFSCFCCLTADNQHHKSLQSNQKPEVTLRSARGLEPALPDIAASSTVRSRTGAIR